MTDQFGREIDYLRISVTDRCNLRCRYCMPEEGIAFTGHDKVLSFEEIARICRCMGKLGIRKIKLTGGEPLVRRGIIKLIKMIKEIPSIDEVTLTTNGILLEEKLISLKNAGLDGINISLDTLDKRKYKELTRWGDLDTVLSGIKTAASMNFAKIKINTLMIRDFNLTEAAELAGLAQYDPVYVRFIEMMPIGSGKDFQPVYQKEIMELLGKKYGALEECKERFGNGPAVYYKLPGFQGKIGFISAVSHEFCQNCNRIRLTSDGNLKLCLQYKNDLNIKELLAANLGEDKITKEIERAVYEKPMHHEFTSEARKHKNTDQEEKETKNMAQIGG